MHSVKEYKQKVGVGVKTRSSSSFQALTWLLDNINRAPTPSASPSPSPSWASNGVRDGVTVVLIHVYETIRWIVTPMGTKVPVSEVSPAIVERYRNQKRREAEEALAPYTSLCQERQVNAEVHLIEGDSIERELLSQILRLELTDLVLGTSLANPFARDLRVRSITEHVVRHAPRSCTVVVVREGRLFSMKRATESMSLMNFLFSDFNNIPDDLSEDGSIGGFGRRNPSRSESFANHSVERDIHTGPQAPNEPDNRGGDHVEVDSNLEPEDLQAPADSLDNELLLSTRRIKMETKNIIEIARQMSLESERKREEALKEAEQLRRQSVEDAKRAMMDEYEEMLAGERSKFEESQRSLDELTARIDEYERKLAEERAKCEEAYGKLEHLTEELETESQLRREAEERASVESIAKNDAIAALERMQRVLHRLYTTYSYEDLQKATDNFAITNKLGEGAYGPVFKGKLHHMSVAIKCLAQEGVRGRQSFEREVEILGQLHHPHMVMLLGACPENGCIVYEYMANGSLADRLACKGGTPPLPWYVRLRICAEVATALLFLHSRSEPIVHRDLKPGNILLDQNFVSKVSDVGIAKLVPNDITLTVTMNKETLMMGTMAYIDPDYQRTGIVTCESDVYGLGIVMLQILTKHPAVGVTEHVEEAIENNKFHEVLDESAGAWPLEKAMELAKLALRCAEPRRKIRAKLESEVLPILNSLRVYANQEAASTSSSNDAEPVIPSFFICPISQEIMMDPCIAADGYTYERRIIEKWLEGHNTSPMTNLVLAHKNVIPNYTVRSTIKEWMDKPTPPNTR